MFFFFCVPSQDADIAAAPLTISPERTKVVDFTVPFFPVYLTFIYKKIRFAVISTLEDLVEVPDMTFLVPQNSYCEHVLTSSDLPVAMMIWNNAQVCETAIDLNRTRAVLNRTRGQLQYHP